MSCFSIGITSKQKQYIDPVLFQCWDSGADGDTVEPAMSSHPCETRKVAFQDMWLLISGSFVYKM